MGKHEPRGELQQFLILYRNQKFSAVLIPYNIMITWPNLGTPSQGFHQRFQQEGTTGFHRRAKLSQIIVIAGRFASLPSPLLRHD